MDEGLTNHLVDGSDGIVAASSPTACPTTPSRITRKANASIPSSYKGLRLYGKLVLDFLKQKGTTTFEEMVCEIHRRLVQTVQSEAANDKSTRRRVYDVLNVLFSLGMVSKDGKTITLISDAPEEDDQEYTKLEDAKKSAIEAMEKKKSQIEELLLQIISYKSLLLIKKNVSKQLQKNKIDLPFIIVKTPKNANVSCTVSKDKFQHLFTFDQPFEIHDDIEVLKRMGLAFGLENKTDKTIEQLEVFKNMVSKQLDLQNVTQQQVEMPLETNSGSLVNHLTGSMNIRPTGVPKGIGERAPSSKWLDSQPH